MGDNLKMKTKLEIETKIDLLKIKLEFERSEIGKRIIRDSIMLLEWVLQNG